MIAIENETGVERKYFAHPQALVESSEVGPNTFIWAFAHVMEGAGVGANCKIGDHAFIESGVVVGNNVTVKNGVAIWDRVTVEDSVLLGPNSVSTAAMTPRPSMQK